MKQKEKHKNCNTKHSTHHDSSTKPKIIVSDNKTETKIINRNAAEKNISIKPAKKSCVYISILCIIDIIVELSKVNTRESRWNGRDTHSRMRWRIYIEMRIWIKRWEEGRR